MGLGQKKQSECHSQHLNSLARVGPGFPIELVRRDPCSYCLHLQATSCCSLVLVCLGAPCPRRPFPSSVSEFLHHQLPVALVRTLLLLLSIPRPVYLSISLSLSLSDFYPESDIPFIVAPLIPIPPNFGPQLSSPLRLSTITPVIHQH